MSSETVIAIIEFDLETVEGVEPMTLEEKARYIAECLMHEAVNVKLEDENGKELIEFNTEDYS